MYNVLWIHFHNSHTFTYQQTLLHTLFCLFLKSSKAFSVFWRRSEDDAHDTLWTSYVRSIYALFLDGQNNSSENFCKMYMKGPVLQSFLHKVAVSNYIWKLAWTMQFSSEFLRQLFHKNIHDLLLRYKAVFRSGSVRKVPLNIFQYSLENTYVESLFW